MANEFIIKNGYRSQGNSEITGSLNVTAGVTASLQGTASFATSALTASYATQALSASWAPAGGGGTPAGSQGQIQYNDGGAFGSSNRFIFNTSSVSFQHGNGVDGPGLYSHAQGLSTLASGSYSHAEGSSTGAWGYASHAEGVDAIAYGNYSHAEGNSAEAGQNTGYLATMSTGGIITLDASYGDISPTSPSPGPFNPGNRVALDDSAYSSIYTYTVQYIQSCSFDGTNTLVYLLDNTISTPTCIVSVVSEIGANAGTYPWGGYGAHAEGAYSKAIGYVSHAEGTGLALGSYAHAEGGAIAYNQYSHAEGTGQAFGSYSHAEGGSTTFGTATHAEGSGANAGYLGFSTLVPITAGVIELDPKYGDQSAQFAAGVIITIQDDLGEINGVPSVYRYEVASSTYNATPATEITLTDVSVNTATNKFRVGIYGSPNPLTADIELGSNSHAEGDSTITYGYASHAQGISTVALGWYQSVVGTFNTPISQPGAFIVGDGVDDGTRHNLLVAASGSVTISGSLLMSGSILPNVSGSTTSSFSLGSATNAWKDIWVSNGSINMLDATGSIQTSIKSTSTGIAITGSLQGTVSSIVKGEATINFGATPGSNYATTTISTPFVTNNSNIHIYIMSTASADHNKMEHQIFSLYSTVMPDNIIDNTSFDIVALSQLRLDGTFKVRYTINNN